MSKYKVEEQRFLYLMLLDYKSKYKLTNIQLGLVLHASNVTVGHWLRGAEPKKEDYRSRIRRLLQLDWYNDDLSIILNKEEFENYKTPPVVDEQPNYEPNKWSCSRVKTWLESPWDFYCKYVKGIEKPSIFQDALDRGTVLHKFLELTAEGWSRDEIKDYIEGKNEALERYNTLLAKDQKPHKHELKKLITVAPEYEAKFRDLESVPVLSIKGLDNGFRVANKYLDEYGGVESVGKILETEKYITWDMSEYLPKQEFHGYIDAVVEDNDGGIWLVDYKTYSNKPKFDDLRLELQANMYMYVMKEVLGYNVQGFIYDCINPKEKIVGRGYHFHQFKISYNERIVTKVVEDFMTTIEIILKFPDYSIYKKSDYGTAYMNELVHGFDSHIKVNGLEEDE